MEYPNIRTEMERGGFTASELAAGLGLPLNVFFLKLYGKIEFTLYEIECLADLFDCSLDYLVGRMVKKNRCTVQYGGDKKGRNMGQGLFMRLHSVTQL